MILFVALTLRVILTTRFAEFAGDEIRYTIPAVNMVGGHGFSALSKAPYLPSDHTMPLYPIFIAAIYAVGQNNLAVRIIQDLMDLLTCVLVAFISFHLAPASLKKTAAISALAIYGFLSWFTVNWTRYLLTEPLALFVTTLAIAVAILALREKKPLLWAAAGGVCGLALLTRADSVLLIGAFALFLILQFARKRSFSNVGSLSAFCLAVLFVLTPWIVRNYATLGRFQPLANEYGFSTGEYMPTGYLWWARTWMTDETCFRAFIPVFAPGNRSFNPHELPDSAFDSDQEKNEVFGLLGRYNQTGKFTPEMSDEFRSIASERIKRAPFRFFVRLPLTRVASIWLTGFSTHNRLIRLFRILCVLPIIIGGVLGLVLWAANQPLRLLMVLIMLARTLFFAYHYAPEARYIVEAYPPMIAACGVSTAVAWRYLKALWTTRKLSIARVRQGSATSSVAQSTSDD